MLLLMKAACLRRLTELNTLGPRDSLTRFLEAQFVINGAKMDSIVDAIGNAGTAEVRSNFEAIYAAGVAAYYPGVGLDLIEGLHAALGGARLAGIAARFAVDAYRYRAGWPDITAVRDGQMLFREVKTTDRLLASQIATISDVLLPEGLTVDVVQLSPIVA
ncbi:VRR-NUC domain-containing protein [Sphingosinicellaceae bacterium]|nr:VRR-NUC domain-containing protein [Sphingosinicellaceae bacterium]